MQTKKTRNGDTTRCESCCTEVPAYDIVSYGSAEHGYRQLCSRCLNAEVADALGLDDSDNVRLDPIVMTDCAGEKHEFHLRTLLHGSILSLEAFEVKGGDPAGYRFQMLGEPEDELLSLLARLVERIRRALAAKYLVQPAWTAAQCGVGPSGYGNLLPPQRVAG